MTKALLFLVLGGCATVYPECMGDKVCIQESQEYDNIEYIETQFKPSIRACYASGGFVTYSGMMSRRLQKALKTGDFRGIHRTELVGVSCASSF